MSAGPGLFRPPAEPWRIALPNRHYLLALGCYLAMPLMLIAGIAASGLIDPEMARGRADYARDYRLLEMARLAALMATLAVAFVLWLFACHLVIRSRGRSQGWLALAAAGPFGLIALGMLSDRSRAPADLHQQFVRTLPLYWRVPLEVAVLVAVWWLAWQCVVFQRELMIGHESFSSGTPVATIVARHNASGGMWAFSEGLKTVYLAGLIHLLWPVLFNLAGQLFGPGSAGRPSSRP